MFLGCVLNSLYLLPKNENLNLPRSQHIMLARDSQIRMKRIVKVIRIRISVKNWRNFFFFFWRLNGEKWEPTFVRRHQTACGKLHTSVFLNVIMSHRSVGYTKIFVTSCIYSYLCTTPLDIIDVIGTQFFDYIVPSAIIQFKKNRFAQPFPSEIKKRIQNFSLDSLNVHHIMCLGRSVLNYKYAQVVKCKTLLNETRKFSMKCKWTFVYGTAYYKTVTLTCH